MPETASWIDMDTINCAAIKTPSQTTGRRGVWERSSNSQIAAELTLSPKTVRNHISNIFSKLQVADRAQAIVRAREAGLGQ